VLDGLPAFGERPAIMAGKGAVLVAASDAHGTLTDPRGIDVACLIALKREGRPMPDYPNSEKGPPDAVIGVSPGNLRYLDFLSAGILAQSALFVAIFNGISAIWERDLGVLQRYLVSPAPRSALVMGKALSGSVRALSQAVIVYLLAFGLGVGIDLSLMKIMGVVVVIALGAALFSTFSLIIACFVKTRERFMGIGQVLTMPIFFASNAIYPLSLMPNRTSPILIYEYTT
jgi:ABC-type multidrug transport system permease subunit